MKRYFLVLLVALLLGFFATAFTTLASEAPDEVPNRWMFLPLVLSRPGAPSTPEGAQVNAPYFPGGVRFDETAIFWFGEITAERNFSDVRIGYDNEVLYIHTAVYDHSLWYDPQPSPEELTAFDSVSLFLHKGGVPPASPDSNSFRFDGQVYWWEESQNESFHAAYRGTSSGWERADIPFTAGTFWRGNALNDADGDRGWAATFRIPFQSLGLNSPPAVGETWSLGIIVHDRDSAAGMADHGAVWPSALSANAPDSWGRLHFGIPIYEPKQAAPAASAVIRHGLDGVVVRDGMVGGSTTCGKGLDFWTEWGEANYAGAEQVNVQSQHDVADWPCFSKFYLTFPLDSLPAGKSILSASLTIYHFGNAQASQKEPSAAEPSWVQVMSVKDDWEEATLAWNNAPQALESQSGAWVHPLTSLPDWPGVPITWDLSRAVARAYASGEPLRIVLYEADSAYHSGKYFISSDTGDWNASGRPTLHVEWAD